MTEFLADYRLLSISFLSRKPRLHDAADDLFSTALARVVEEQRSVLIDCRRKRVTAGSHFVCGNKLDPAAMRRVYVEQEQVFPCAGLLDKFLSRVGQNPLRSAFVRLSPGIHRGADVIACITDAAHVGRMLGVAAYLGIFDVDCIPAAPTCAALFRPLLLPNTIHLNFIDYFDRDIQAKGFYASGDIIVSMTPGMYRRLAQAAVSSPHGSFIPGTVPTYRVKPLKRRGRRHRSVLP